MCNELAQRWGVSKATVGRYVRKLIALDYISAVSFTGTHGTALYLKNYLSTMFQISDILVDKDEVAMALHLSVSVDEYAEAEKTSGSNSHMEIIVQKVLQILSTQGFPCFSCQKFGYKLLPLSHDCKREFYFLRVQKSVTY